MNKKFKKLICGVLTLAMLATSGIASLADETKETTATETAATEVAVASDNADATEEPAQTEAPTAEPTEAPTAEPTEAPTAEPTEAPDPYAADTYYQKALELCSALGIITGYEDGSVKPESTVTRAEMAAIILRMTNLTSLSTYRNLFTDVSSSHWAANTIQTASDEGVINGMGDGTFAPDGEVLYEQAVKMAVCGMNYENEAKMKGGYPDGYLTVAAVNLSLLDSVKGNVGTAITRGEIIKLVYNALLGPYNDLKTYSGGQPVYDSTETLAKAKFDLFEAKGLLVATSTKSITSENTDKGQIMITTSDTDVDTFVCDLTNIDDLVGNKITFYYVKKGVADEKVVAIVTDKAKTKEVTLTSSQIDKFGGFEDGNGEIETYDGKDYETVDATIIYNSQFISPNVYNAAVKAASTSEKRFDLIGCDGVNYGTKMSFDQFIKPRVGTVKLVDNNNDGKYDVVFIDSYETLLVSSATDKKIIGTINNEAATLDVDTTANMDLSVTVLLDGSEAKTKNLKKNNVVSLKRNLDNTTILLSTVENSITGKVTNMEAAEPDMFAIAQINGQDYYVDVNALADVRTGVEGTFKLDAYNRIGYVETSSVISASEKYGWILSAYLSDDGEDYKVRLFTQDGSVSEYNFADKVNYWSPSNPEGSSICTRSELNKELEKIDYNNATNAEQSEIRLVKFSVNAKNEITKFFVATKATEGYDKGSVYSTADETYDKTAVTINLKDHNGTISTGNLSGNYYFTGEILEFTVPSDSTKMKNGDNYSIATVAASSYLSKEGGLGKHCVFGEFSDSKQTTPTVCINFVSSSDEPAPISNYGSASNYPVIIVDRVYEGVDADDETVYIISGYQGGSQVKYTTTSNATLGKLTGVFSSSNKEYSNVSTKLWDAMNGVVDFEDASEDIQELYGNADSIKDILGKGDILGVRSNDKGAEVLILMVDASELAEQVRSGEVSTLYNSKNGASETRDNITIGPVSDSMLNDVAIMSVAGIKTSFDAARTMDTVVIDPVGDITIDKENLSTISDIVDFDADEVYGHYAFVRTANKGSLQEIYLFRFED